MFSEFLEFPMEFIYESSRIRNEFLSILHIFITCVNSDSRVTNSNFIRFSNWHFLLSLVWQVGQHELNVKERKMYNDKVIFPEKVRR